MFNKINEKLNGAFIAVQTAISTPVERKPELKSTRISKKIISAATTISVAATMLTTSAAAAEIPAFFNDAVDILGVVIILIGAGIGVWGIVNLLEGYGNDNPGAKSQGMKQLMAGVGIALVGIIGPGALKNLFAEQAATVGN